jgi:hypothetical protein
MPKRYVFNTTALWVMDSAWRPSLTARDAPSDVQIESRPLTRLQPDRDPIGTQLQVAITLDQHQDARPENSRRDCSAPESRGRTGDVCSSEGKWRCLPIRIETGSTRRQMAIVWVENEC